MNFAGRTLAPGASAGVETTHSQEILYLQITSWPRHLREHHLLDQRITFEQKEQSHAWI